MPCNYSYRVKELRSQYRYSLGVKAKTPQIYNPSTLNSKRRRIEKMFKKIITALILVAYLVMPAMVIAEEVAPAPPAEQAVAAEPAGPKVDTGDTAWVLISTALVMLMTPGLALFYGGMVRRKNVLGTIMHSFILIAWVSVIWALYGYSLAFHEGSFWGGFDWAFLQGVGADPDPYGYGATIQHQVFMAFQLMFAIITPALISGAFAERIKFSAMLMFMWLWSSLVYSPLAHWVWGKGGYLRFGDPAAIFGALDFAGGTVVHISSGVSALIMALLLGKRVGFGKHPIIPHNMTMTVTGASLLWFGWFGFNAGRSEERRV